MEDLPLGRIAAFVPEFAVTDLPLDRTLMMIRQISGSFRPHGSPNFNVLISALLEWMYVRLVCIVFNVRVVSEVAAALSWSLLRGDSHVLVWSKNYVCHGSSTFWVRGSIYIFHIILRAAVIADYKIIMDILNIIIGAWAAHQVTWVKCLRRMWSNVRAVEWAVM